MAETLSQDTRPLPKRIQIVDQALLDQVSEKAQASTRRRMNYNLHELSDPLQRMLNALEPDTYVRPHRHVDPDKNEVFVVLRGKLAVFIFDDAGSITRTVHLAPDATCVVDIPAGHWHSLLALESGTVVFEAKDGPYIASTDKDFAVWAPREGTTAAEEYRLWLQRTLRSAGEA